METIRYGSRGNGVRLLQLALKREGSYRGAMDGIFGTRTLNAVRRFQSVNGLTPDGAAGPRTLAAMEPYFKGFVKHRLRAGDTFYRLAKKYGVSSDDIAAANPALDPAELPIGAEAVIPLGFPAAPVDVEYSSALIEIITEGLTGRYPFVSSEIIGRSVLGKPIFALRMGTGPREVLINAAHHANEWITSPLVLDFLESFAAAYSRRGTVGGRSADALYRAVTLYVVPMVDPDGVDLVNGAVDRAGFAKALSIAEDYPDLPFTSGWKANIEGTDLNLNYPAGWEEAKKIKYSMGYTGPAPRDFTGSAPLSAPEARAMYDFTKSHDFALTISYHTQGGEIYWRYGEIEPNGSRGIAEAMAEVSGYSVADAPFESGYAGYKDWFINEYRRPGFTVEAGRGRNPLPLSQYGEIRRDNFPLIVTALEKA